MEVVFLPSAANDLEDVAQKLHGQGRARAGLTIDLLKAEGETLAELPARGEALPKSGARYLPVVGTDYVFIYVLREDIGQVQISRILERDRSAA